LSSDDEISAVSSTVDDETLNDAVVTDADLYHDEADDNKGLLLLLLDEGLIIECAWLLLLLFVTISVVADFFFTTGVGKEDVNAWTSTTACKKPNSSSNMTEVDAVVIEVFLLGMMVSVVYYLLMISLSLFSLVQRNTVVSCLSCSRLFGLLGSVDVVVRRVTQY
jgi:hypothetical protein